MTRIRADGTGATAAGGVTLIGISVVGLAGRDRALTGGIALVDRGLGARARDLRGAAGRVVGITLGIVGSRARAL